MLKLKLPEAIKKPNFKSKKALGLALLGVVVLAVAGWLIFANNSPLKDNEKPYAEAAGHKIYKQEIDDLLGKNVYKISEHDAATVLADKYLLEALAKEHGITVSDKELADQFDKDTLKQKNSFKYGYQSKLNSVYLSKLSAYNKGVYKGKFLIANFSQHIQVYPTLPEDKMHDPDLGNPKAIERDKKYAESFITDLYNKIASGEITFNQAIKMEQNDPRVGRKAYPSLQHSGKFDTTLDSSQILNNESIRQQVASIKAGETTKPFVVKVGNSLADPKSKVDSYFLVVHMDETSGSYNGMDFNQYLDQAKERLGYGVYI